MPVWQLCATTHIHVWKWADLCYRFDGLPGAENRESVISKGQGTSMRPFQMSTFHKRSVQSNILESFLLKMLLKCNRWEWGLHFHPKDKISVQICQQSLIEFVHFVKFLGFSRKMQWKASKNKSFSWKSFKTYENVCFLQKNPKILVQNDVFGAARYHF